MPDFWRTTVTRSNVVRTPSVLDPPPTPDHISGTAATPPNAANGPVESFWSIDFYRANPFSIFTFYISITIECSLGFVSPAFTAPEWLVTETHAYHNFDNSFSFVFATFNSTNGSNGAAFLNNATLKIERDDTNAKFIVTGLMGNSELTFIDAGGVDTATDFAAFKLTLLEGPYVYGGSPAPPTPPNLVKGHAEVAFSSFYTYKNDMAHPYRGASLASGQRGHWVPSPGAPSYDASYTPWFVPLESPNTWIVTNPDTASTIVAGITSGADETTNTTVFEERDWDLRFFFPVAGTKIDLTHSWEHGAHWTASVLPSATSVLNWRRSHDKGNSWTTGVIDSSGGDVDSPSINWTFGKLVAVWYRGASIVQSISSDLGTSWGTPMALSISGSNPRHLVDPNTGFSFYFFFDDNKLKLLRSGNLGTQFVEATPIVVIDPMDQQTVAAQLALDGSLLVTYFAAGAVAQIRSVDLGRTWSPA